MFDALIPLVKAVLVVPITLLPIINPPSVAAFMLLCIGLDILWTGWVELNAVQRPLQAGGPIRAGCRPTPR